MGGSPANAAQSRAFTGEKSGPLPAMAKQSFIRKKGAGRGGVKGKGVVADFTTGVLNVPHTPPIPVLPVVPGTEYLGEILRRRENWPERGSGKRA